MIIQTEAALQPTPEIVRAGGAIGVIKFLPRYAEVLLHGLRQLTPLSTEHQVHIGIGGAAHFLQRAAGEHGAQCGLGGEHSPEGLNIVGGVGVIHPEPDQINQGTGIRTGIGPGIRPGDRGLHQREQCQPSSLQPASRIPTEACRLHMEQRRLMGDAG